MCQCTPEIRTPWCGKPGCEMPKQESPGERIAKQYSVGGTLNESTATLAAAIDAEIRREREQWEREKLIPLNVAIEKFMRTGE